MKEMCIPEETWGKSQLKEVRLVGRSEHRAACWPGSFGLRPGVSLRITTNIIGEVLDGFDQNRTTMQAFSRPLRSKLAD